MHLIHTCGNMTNSPGEEQTKAMPTSAKHIYYKSIYKIIENSVLNSTIHRDKVQVFQLVKQPSNRGGDVHG